MRILLIEDSRMLRIAIERSLIKAGYQVVAAEDGERGLSLAQSAHPDVILLDMMLPTMEGTGVLRQLKRDATTKLIPVIVLSSLSQKNERKLKMEGASAYFEKSKLNLEDNAQALIQTVNEVFSGCHPEGPNVTATGVGIVH